MPSHKRPRPPRLTEALLSLSIRPGIRREDIVGGLSAEFLERVEASGYRRANAWYRRQAIGLIARAVWSRATSPEIDVGGGWGMDSVLQDLRFGVRSLVRDPGFALVAILMLGLGVGVTTSMFTVVNSVLFRPLPFFEPDRLVALSVRPPGRLTDASEVLAQHIIEIRRQSSSFTQVAAYRRITTTLSDVGDAARLNTAFVTSEFFGVLGVGPILGSGFRPGDDEVGASPIVVLGNALWRTRFGADPDIVGKTATLDGVSRTITGVMPPRFDFPERADVWLPLALEAWLGGSDGSLLIPTLARLDEGVSMELATAELSAIAAELPGLAAGRAEPGSSAAAPSVRVFPLRELVVGGGRYPLLIFTGAVLLVLLIACSNVANLLLIRARTREQEIGLRKALGARNGRLVRQLLTESTLLALLGGTFGVLVAAVGVQALLALAPPGTIPRGQEVGLDLTALTFTLAISALAGIGFGLAPAYRASRRELRDTIADGARTLSPRRRLGQGVLVVSEVGLAVVLLTGAGLLVRSFQQIRAVDLGFQPDNTVTFYVDLPEYSYPSPETMADLYRQVLAGLRQIPGVEAAGASNFEPFIDFFSATTRVTGEDGTEGGSQGGMTIASAGYFRSMGIPLLSGRAFAAQDDGSAQRVAIINRSHAERLWPGRDPVGRRVGRGRNPGNDDWMTVVGVVEDMVHNSVTETKTPRLYLPFQQLDGPLLVLFGHMSFVIRTNRSVRNIAPAIRAVLADADPNLPVQSLSTMDDVVLATIGDRLFQTRILGAFAVLALLLAAVGIYGVTAYSVNEQRHEFAVRMALGARAGQVANMTLVRVLKLVVPGLLLGFAASLAATRLIVATLYEVTPTDPTTLVGVALLLGGVAIAAALVPTRRATRIDPVDVLSG